MPSTTSPPGDPPDLFAVAMAALTVLTAAADALPVVLVVDDLHWFDAPSADVLGFVMRRIHDDAIVAFVACRPDAARQGDARELELPPLDPSDARGAARAQRRRAADAQSPRDPALGGGQPAGDRRAGPRRQPPVTHASLRIDEEIPLTARLIDAFAQRTVGLDDTARAVLLAAALAPGTNSDEIVRVPRASAAGTSPSHAALDVAVDAGLLIDDDAHVAFRHPLARAAVIATSTRSERRTMHDSLAAIIKEPERNLWHRAQAAVGTDDDLAGELDDLAGRRPGPQVIDILVRAAGLTGDTDLRARRLIRAGELAIDLADRDHASSSSPPRRALEPTGADRRRLRALRIASDDTVPQDTRPSLELISLSQEALADGDVDAAVAAPHPRRRAHPRRPPADADRGPGDRAGARPAARPARPARHVGHRPRQPAAVQRDDHRTPRRHRPRCTRRRPGPPPRLRGDVDRRHAPGRRGVQPGDRPRTGDRRAAPPRRRPRHARLGGDRARRLGHRRPGRRRRARARRRDRPAHPRRPRSAAAGDAGRWQRRRRDGQPARRRSVTHHHGRTASRTTAWP